MIGFLASWFIKDYQNTSDAAVRRAYGVLCGAVGIVINLLLFALKLFAGTLAGSVAVTADAFNNLSDAGASIVTLLGFRLAGQKPDPEHPFGHGRLEYISGLIVSIVILLMGFELLRDAVAAGYGYVTDTCWGELENQMAQINEQYGIVFYDMTDEERGAYREEVLQYYFDKGQADDWDMELYDVIQSYA